MALLIPNEDRERIEERVGTQTVNTGSLIWVVRTRLSGVLNAKFGLQFV